MKIVTRKELIELVKNKNILISEIVNRELEGFYEVSYFSETDFIKTSLISRVDNEKTYLSLEDMNNKIDFSLDLDCGCRDGLYNDRAIYALYDEEDIKKLLMKLMMILGNKEETYEICNE